MGYKVLKNQSQSLERYKIVPIRFEDRYQIMKWRNEQIYHLRQTTPLTETIQDLYFNEVVSKLFNVEQPDQLLFSFLENDICIGYGGLVHINWEHKNAEISFVFNTLLDEKFIELWSIFLKLIERVAFIELGLNKIYTYAFDLRPKLYIALENSNYFREATLINHISIDGIYKNVVIHSKLKNNIYTLRKVDSIQDIIKLYEWALDVTVRENSLSPEKFSLNDHLNWYNKKVNEGDSKFFIMTDLYKSHIGQIRLDKIDNYFEIDYSISNFYRGMGLGNEILKLLLAEVGNVTLLAKVKVDNLRSRKIFINNGFKVIQEKDSLIFFQKLRDDE